MIRKLFNKSIYINKNIVTTKKFLQPTAFSIDGITYEISTPTTVKIISSKKKSGVSSIKIPTKVTYQKNKYIVTQIGASAFANNYNLNSITIPDSICNIEEKAFAYNYGLVQVVSDIKKPLVIDKSVFGYASENCKLIVPTESVTNYKTADVWKNFNSITDIYPFTIDGISYEITSNTTVKLILNITKSYTGSITIPATVTHNNVTYKVTQISDRAFSYNKDITSVRIGNNITTIKNSTFNSCSNLSFVYVPSSVISIGSSAFEDCVRLSCITIPSSINSIESSAFSGSGVNKFTFPSAVNTIKTAFLARVLPNYAYNR